MGTCIECDTKFQELLRCYNCNHMNVCEKCDNDDQMLWACGSCEKLNCYDCSFTCLLCEDEYCKHCVKTCCQTCSTCLCNCSKKPKKNNTFPCGVNCKGMWCDICYQKAMKIIGLKPFKVK